MGALCFCNQKNQSNQDLRFHKINMGIEDLERERPPLPDRITFDEVECCAIRECGMPDDERLADIGNSDKTLKIFNHFKHILCMSFLQGRFNKFMLKTKRTGVIAKPANRRQISSS